jgi:membrane associated rhomboid family serine protease
MLDSAVQGHRWYGSDIVIYGLILINVMVYAVICASFNDTSFSADQAMLWGAQYYEDIDGGQIWRLLTSNYVHFSPEHILFNMIALYYWGKAIAPRFGPREFFLMYTFSGILGGVISYLPHENMVSGGASGAISGLLGAMLVLNLKGCSEFNKAFIVQNIILNIAIAVATPVDWKAHLGGFIGGSLWTAVRFKAKDAELTYGSSE